MILLPTSAMAEDTLKMFNATDDLVDYDAVLFNSSMYALRDKCEATEEPYLIAICDESDKAINAVLDDNMCLELNPKTTDAFNECQSRAALLISASIQHQFNQHILNGGQACDFSEDYQCFTVDKTIFAFRNQPA